MSLLPRNRRLPSGRPKPNPIPDTESIDLVGKRCDGGVDLGIVAAGPLDNAPEILQALRHKIGLYLSVTGREDFQADMGHPPPEKISIILICPHTIHPAAAAALEECRRIVEARGMRFETRKSMKDTPAG